MSELTTERPPSEMQPKPAAPSGSAPGMTAKPEAHHAPPPPPPKAQKVADQIRRDGQWICDVKDPKGKNCEGHLKRWYFLTAQEEKKYGKRAEIYRCKECHTYYLPPRLYERICGAAAKQ